MLRAIEREEAEQLEAAARAAFASIRNGGCCTCFPRATRT